MNRNVQGVQFHFNAVLFGLSNKEALTHLFK